MSSLVSVLKDEGELVWIKKCGYGDDNDNDGES